MQQTEPVVLQGIGVEGVVAAVERASQLHRMFYQDLCARESARVDVDFSGAPQDCDTGCCVQVLVHLEKGLL